MPVFEEPRSCRGKSYFCAVELAILVMGGKWKPLILWHLSHAEKLRFGELRKCIPGITQKMLTQQLRELEGDDMVERQVYAEIPPRVEYRLTQFGRGVVPLLREMYRWGKDFEERFGSSQSEGCPLPPVPSTQA